MPGKRRSGRPRSHAPNANAFFSDPVLADYAASLGSLGEPSGFTATGSSLRGGLRIRGFRIRAGQVSLDLTLILRPDGLIEQYVVQRSG